MTNPVNVQDITSFLNFVYQPGQHFEIRPWRDGGGSPSFGFTWNGTEDAEEITAKVVSLSESWTNIGVVVNPRKQAEGSGSNGATTDADIEECFTLFVDFDDVGTFEACEKAEAAGLPRPSLVIDSGRPNRDGAHLYWCFQEGMDKILWRGLTRRLIKILGSDPAVKNPARIMRLPGTFNKKRGAACRVVYKGTAYMRAEDMGIEPLVIQSESAPPPLPGIPPDLRNLSGNTKKFLDPSVTFGEGTRNHAVFAAACDFAGNNIPIADALRYVASKAVSCGLSEDEARKAIESAYSQNRNPIPLTTAESEEIINSTPHLTREEYERLLGGEEVEVEVAAEEEEHEPAPPEHVVDPPYVPTGTPAPETSKVTLPPQRDRLDLTRITNYIERIEEIDGERVTFKDYRTVDEICEDLQKKCHGWPKYSPATGAFVIRKVADNDYKMHALGKKKSHMSSWLHSGRVTQHWAGGRTKDERVWNGRQRVEPVSFEELYEFVNSAQNPQSFETVQDYPTHPKVEGAFYMPMDLPEADGKALKTFMDKLNPETELDRQLMLAAMLTPGWGGPPGLRPVFLFSSQHGQGSGKTETALAIAAIWGGALELTYTEKWAELTKSIFSGEDYLSRVFLFDNIKKRFEGGSIESAVTAQRLSGWQSYRGQVSRPNDVTYFITFNVPDMSRDFAQRSVEIRIGPQQHKNNFASWWRDWIPKNRAALIADLLAILRGPARGSIESSSRWKTWESAVLSRCSSQPEDLAKLLRDRRGGIDTDSEIADEIITTFDDYFREERLSGRRAEEREGRPGLWYRTTSLELFLVATGDDVALFRPRGDMGRPQQIRAFTRHLTQTLNGRGGARGALIEMGKTRNRCDSLGKPTGRAEGARWGSVAWWSVEPSEDDTDDESGLLDDSFDPADFDPFAGGE